MTGQVEPASNVNDHKHFQKTWFAGGLAQLLCFSSSSSAAAIKVFGKNQNAKIITSFSTPAFGGFHLACVHLIPCFLCFSDTMFFCVLPCIYFFHKLKCKDKESLCYGHTACLKMFSGLKKSDLKIYAITFVSLVSSSQLAR